MVHRDVKTQNVLLAREHCGGDNGGGDWLANTKVADFGTVRKDVRPKVKPDLATDLTGNGLKSHASTAHIIGTRSYMPLEYLVRGHVSPKTAAFSFGIVVVELLTTLDGAAARDLIEDGGSDCRSDTASLNDDLLVLPAVLQLVWPKPVLAALAAVAERCVEVKPRVRSTVAVEMNVLEAALTMGGS
jgi:serine/threonine protein kinase